MQKSVTLVLLLLFFCSCQKKKPVENIVQRTDNYVQPASQDEIDTTQSYISPSDALNDQSPFDQKNFEPQRIRYRGLRTIVYEISSTQAMNNDLTVVVEYLRGTNENGDSISTASRVLLFAKNVLVYRKAFMIEFINPTQLSASRTFDHVVYTVSPTKAIIYYWLEIVRKDDPPEKEYHGICVDNEGVTNELSGDIKKIGGGYATIRFLNETRLKAKVSPGIRYPYLSIDLIYSIDWKLCNAALDVPIDTVFSIAEQPIRFFNSRIKLYSSPDRSASFQETNFKKLTQGQMRRIFVPSLFDAGFIQRDHLFVEFNRTTSGWIDYDSMVFEEIISEN